NRLLAYILIKADIVDRIQGRIATAEQTRDALWSVSLKGLRGDENREFELLVTRHGPDKTYFNTLFPELSTAVAELAGKLARLDLTRTLDSETRKFFNQASLGVVSSPVAGSAIASSDDASPPSPSYPHLLFEPEFRPLMPT